MSGSIGAANLSAFATKETNTTNTSASAKAQAAFSASTSRGFDSGFENTFAAIEKQFSTNPNYGQTTTTSALDGVQLTGNLSKWLGVGAKPATGISQLS